MFGFELTAFGRLAADPVVRQTNTGQNVTNFRLACDTSYTDRSTGQRVERVDWISCAAWNGLGGVAAQFLHKGEMVAVRGRPVARAFVDRSGNTQASIEMVVDDLRLLPNRAPGQGNNAQGNGNGAQANGNSAQPPQHKTVGTPPDGAALTTQTVPAAEPASVDEDSVFGMPPF